MIGVMPLCGLASPLKDSDNCIQKGGCLTLLPSPPMIMAGEGEHHEAGILGSFGHRRD